MHDLRAVQNKIREFLEAYDWTMRQLSMKAELDPGYVQQFLKNTDRVNDWGSIEKIADALGCFDIDDMLAKSPTPRALKKVETEGKEPLIENKEPVTKDNPGIEEPPISVLVGACEHHLGVLDIKIAKLVNILSLISRSTKLIASSSERVRQSMTNEEKMAALRVRAKLDEEFLKSEEDAEKTL